MSTKAGVILIWVFGKSWYTHAHVSYPRVNKMKRRRWEFTVLVRMKKIALIEFFIEISKTTLITTWLRMHRQYLDLREYTRFQRTVLRVLKIIKFTNEESHIRKNEVSAPNICIKRRWRIVLYNKSSYFLYFALPVI